MMQHLNRQSFAPFGKVLRDSLASRGFPRDEAWKESVHYFNVGESRFQRCNAPVYLDFELGMTVLALRREGETVCFYLDKPVCLAPEVEFAIVPYQRECSVRMAVPLTAELLTLDALGPMETLKIGDRLRLGEIYTLFYREVESGFLFKGESHTMYELTYVDRGQLHCVVGGNGFTLNQGQMMVFAPEQWHMQYTELDASARFLTVSFDLTSELPLRLGDRVFDLSGAETVYLKQLIREIQAKDPLAGDVIRCNLKLLLLSVLRDTGGRRRRQSQKPQEAPRNDNTIVSRTLQYIADHVYDKMSVETVAYAVGVSASHLTALFRRQMNISPGEYIRRVKLEESKDLIREGQMNFSQIAAKLNYSTIHHFSRQFKDNFGISPSEYAKSVEE